MKYIKRNIEREVRILSKEFPILVITGPRQSGKTTLTKKMFSKYEYVSLENYDNRELAQKDPRAFFAKYPKKVIIDEMQRVPELFSYLQTQSDEINKPGQFIITGSQNYLLMEKITQSLAGRVGLVNLLPFSSGEIEGISKIEDTNKIIFQGGYPRLHVQKIRPEVFYEAYITTYIERDVRKIINIKDVNSFKKFLVVLAGRTGQVLNVNAISVECEISRETVNEWLNILELSFIIFRLRPFYKNYKKQVTKAPKILFYDTGVVCNLLGISDKNQLEKHYLRGSIFETLVINEFVKSHFNFGGVNKVYYWRDNKGREIDLVFEEKQKQYGVEIKMAQTVRNDFFKNLKFWNVLDKNNKSIVIYDGKQELQVHSTRVVNWRNVSQI
jgi:predicted AAA+ superfamily ATPase